MNFNGLKKATSLALSNEELHVWQMKIAAASSETHLNSACLSDSERELANRFKTDSARRMFIAARSGLREILGQYLAAAPSRIRFSHEANGKPRLADLTSDVRFNVAHSGVVALIVVARGCDVGVDVERLRKVERLEQIAARYFHPAETVAILKQPSPERSSAFLRCWTGKEAVLKAIGCGVSGALDQFEAPIAAHQGVWIDVLLPSANQSKKCWLQSLELDAEYVAAVACVGEKRRTIMIPSAHYA